MTGKRPLRDQNRALKDRLHAARSLLEKHHDAISEEYLTVAFNNCEQMVDLELPEGLETLQEYTFQN